MMNKKFSWMITLVLLLLFSAPGHAAEIANESASTEERPTRLVGPLQSISSPELWLVAGISVHLTAETRVDERVGAPAAGVWVRIDGRSDGAGGLQALRVKVLPPQRQVSLQGDLDELTDVALSVDGILLATSPSTHIVGEPQAGEDRVRVRAVLLPQGGLLALQVRRLGHGDEWIDKPEPDDLERGEGVRLIGRVQSIDPNSGSELVVSGVAVQLGPTSEVEERVGPLLVGGWVRVDGLVDGSGVLMAKRLRTLETQDEHRVTGTLRSADGTGFNVGGIWILRVDGTEVEDALEIGKPVKVEAGLNAEGRLVASKVSLENQRRPNRKDIRRFVGRIEALPPDGLSGEWRIGNVVVQVEEGVTLIDDSKGPIQIGARVLIEGRQRSDGVIVALEIRSLPQDGMKGREIRFTGPIEELPAAGLVGLWRVGGRSLRVTEQTELKSDDGFEIGESVKVRGHMGADGTILAEKVEEDE